MKIACSRYTDKDELVIRKATELGLPLIGGTALELWANHTKTPGVRKRSDNDLDFIVTSPEKLNTFKRWLIQNIDPNKVKVDAYDADESVMKYATTVDGVLIMKPEYLLWSKLTRPDRSAKDLRDIQWISSIKTLTDEEINEALDDLGVTEDEFETLLKYI